MKGIAIGSFVVGSLVAFCAAGSASGAFVGFFVNSTDLTHEGQALTVYTLTARFNGSTDTVVRAFNLAALSEDGLSGYWHKDNSSVQDAASALSQQYGSWDPTHTGSTTLNRPYDSYLTVGGIARAANTSIAENSWFNGGNADTRGWARADLPNNGALAWVNSATGNGQGLVGNSLYVASTDVRLGQFVLSQDHSFRELSLSIAYNNGAGGATETASGNFSFGVVPTPGAFALLGIAGLVTNRRRR